MRACARGRLRVNPQARSILQIARNTVSGSDGKDYVILPVCFHACGNVDPPSENRVGPPIGQESGYRSKYASDLEVSTLEFLAKADCPVRTWSIWLRRELWGLEDDVGARLFYRKVEGCLGTQGESITKLWISNGHHTVWPLKV